MHLFEMCTVCINVGFLFDCLSFSFFFCLCGARENVLNCFVGFSATGPARSNDERLAVPFFKNHQAISVLLRDEPDVNNGQQARVPFQTTM